MSIDQELLEVADKYDWKNHNFVKNLYDAKYLRAAFKIYALRLYLAAKALLVDLPILLSQTPDPLIRFHLIENLLEEEGIICKGDQLYFQPQRRHPELAKHFTRACGISDAELATHSIPKSHRLERFLQHGQWLAALAYITVGAEANVSPLFNLLIPPLRDQYHFTEDDLIFLREHVTADAKHGATGAKLVAQAIQSPQQREEALLGVQAGATAMWTLHQQVDREIRHAQLLF